MHTCSNVELLGKEICPIAARNSSTVASLLDAPTGFIWRDLILEDAKSLSSEKVTNKFITLDKYRAQQMANGWPNPLPQFEKY